MSQIPFKEYLNEKFLEWEKLQKNKRSTITAFARWLSENSSGTVVRQQVVDTWLRGAIPKEHKYILVLIEKLGDEIYDILEIPRPNPYKQIVDRVWEFLPEEVQARLSEEAAEYETKNISNRVSKASKQRKARHVK